MRVATAGGSAPATEWSVGRALDELTARLAGPPDLVLAYYTAGCAEAVVDALRGRVPAGRFAGGSSSCGVMTDEGLLGFDGPAFAVLGLRDAEGAYGTGFASIDAPEGTDRALLTTPAMQAARQAYAAAVDNADRPGELPELLWVLAVPGVEEAVLRGLDDVTGGKVPIVGGTVADDTVEGHWSCFAGDGLGTDGVAVVALFPSTGLVSSFQSGYEPAGVSGVVTRATGRVIEEIDGRPAAEVYDDWTHGLLAPALSGTDPSILDRTALCPLGREVGRITVDQQPIPYYSLIHPERVTSSHGIVGFAGVAEGERLHLMKGSIESMVSRAGRVADAARSLLTERRHGRPGAEVAGGLVIYCAGCMRAVGDELPRVATELATAFGGAPFLGAFTYGEQGCLLGGENRHGNLMISVAVFER